MRLRLLLLLFAGLLAAGSSLTGQSASATSSLLFGQKQAYTAIVRTDQKVVTYAKLIYTNPESTAFSKSSFTVPSGVEVSDMSAYQILPPSRCDNGDLEETTERMTYEYVPSCRTIKEGVYDLSSYGYYYSRGETSLRYKPVTLQKQGATYSFTLPQAIESQEQGAILISYVAQKGYVSGNLGLYNLTFKTLQVPQAVEEVRVAVDVSSDLYTRSGKSSVESSDLLESGISSGVAADRSGNISSSSLDRLQSGIGSGGAFTKTGKSLVAGETFVVKGEFADEPWKLNIGWIIGSSIGLIAVLALSFFLMKKANSVHSKTAKNTKKGKK